MMIVANLASGLKDLTRPKYSRHALKPSAKMDDCRSCVLVGTMIRVEVFMGEEAWKAHGVFSSGISLTNWSNAYLTLNRLAHGS